MDKASTRCPSCSAESPAGASYCPKCGEPVSAVSQLPTNMASPSVAEAARRPVTSSRVGRLASSDSIQAGGFTPGTILAERYRIIGLLGRGGMGEVYRADDLKLGQPVALKFLPRHLASDEDRLDRFYAEVRIARQVSHPNVCRVYDVGEIDGQQYLSMEYVDGEDLASLLKRIGRLPPDKALEISRELCAGLAAAHDKGVLHRDLKPANVMIDGRGRARITDFGLAVAADAQSDGDISGTPAYMAPEQLAGKGASVRSDIYALGLVLYELSTGKKAFDGASLDELRRKHTHDSPVSPSNHSPGFDPVVERVILHCLEKDPAARPASAAKVAASLPGGDPLAAALAAGETPSPEMVAAAGERDAVPASTVRRLLIGLAVALGLSLVFTPRSNITAFSGMEKSPEILRERAREILQASGLGRPADWSSWFRTESAFVTWAASHGGLRGDLSRDAVAFAYRQSPSSLLPLLTPGPFPSPVVDSMEPAPVVPGMAEVRTDPRGRLVRLSIVPPQLEPDTTSPAETDWTMLFREAGLDMQRFNRVAPRWSPRSFATERAAWEGPHPERPGVTMRVEAASYRGRPVEFRWIGPWTRPLGNSVFPEPGAGDLVFLAILLMLVLGSGLVARRNLRAGRGDRRGAIRIGILIFIVQSAVWILGGHHVAASEEGWLFIAGFTNAAAMGTGFWLIYLALEPFARRRWPQMLISWTRALSRSLRDPLVGRDLLIGAVVGATAGLLTGPLRILLPLTLGVPGPPPLSFDPSGTLAGAVARLPALGTFASFWVLGIVFFLVLTRSIVRNGWIAGFIVTILYTANYLGMPSPWITLPLAALSVGAVVLVTVRFGLLAGIVAEWCRWSLGDLLPTNDPARWDFAVAMLIVAVVAAIAWWGSRAALAGRPLFGGLGLEEKKP